MAAVPARLVGKASSPSTYWGIVGAPAAGLARATSGPYHRQDARLDGRRQLRPRLNHGSQFGVNGAILSAKCAAFCAALDRTY